MITLTPAGFYAWSINRENKFLIQILILKPKKNILGKKQFQKYLDSCFKCLQNTTFSVTKSIRMTPDYMEHKMSCICQLLFYF